MSVLLRRMFQYDQTDLRFRLKFGNLLRPHIFHIGKRVQKFGMRKGIGRYFSKLFSDHELNFSHEYTERWRDMSTNLLNLK